MNIPCTLIARQPKKSTSIDDVCGSRAFLYTDSYRNEVVYRLLPRKDRYIDPAGGLDVLCMRGDFLTYMTKEQLSLYRSKTLVRSLDDIRSRKA